MLSVNSLCERLHKEGKKVTPQRRLIYTALQENQTHPRAEDIYEQVRAIMPDISLATVYKTLRELVEMGEVLEIKYGGEQSRFDPLNIPHNHLVCMQCNRIDNVLQYFSIPEPDATENPGYQIRQTEIIYWGVCSACSAALTMKAIS
jgi:Fe2+ or Zn2+ uptake regulation protein